MKKFKSSDYRIRENGYGGFYIQERRFGLFIPWLSTMGWWMTGPFWSTFYSNYYHSYDDAWDFLLQLKFASDRENNIL